MAEKKVSAWRCKNGHTMGQVMRNGRGIRQLLLYRQAMDEAAEQQPEVDVMAVVEGFAAEIRCSRCGDLRTWMPGEEAMRHLIEQARRLRVAVEPVK